MPLRRLDWGVWIYGLLAAFFGGGGAALGAAVGLMATDTTSLDHPQKMLQVMAYAFVLPGIASVALYLKQSPLPPEIKTTVETTEIQSNPPAIVKTTVETTEQPK